MSHGVIEMMEKRDCKSAMPRESVDEDFVFVGEHLSDQVRHRFRHGIVCLREDARAGMCAQCVVAVAHSSGTQLRESIVHLGHRDGTMCDVHQLMNVAPIESDD